jgi:hypothetical protein
MPSTNQQQSGKDEPQLEPGKHLPLRYNVFPKDENERPPCVLRGGTEARTTAYVFWYPFDIVVQSPLVDIYDLDIDRRKVTIYPPFRSRSDSEPAIENVPLAKVPYRPNAAPPAYPWLVAPEITLGRDHNLQRTDSLRIDVPKDEPYEFAARLAESLIGLIRGFTKQWWVKRGSEHPRTHIRHWFDANELGERLAGVGTFRFFYGGMGFERLLDSRSWRAVAEALRRQETIPLSWDIFLDAIYFHSTDDLRRSILEVAISNEILLAEALNIWCFKGRLAKRQVKRVLHGSDYINHLRRVGALWNRPLEKEHPDEFSWITAAWVARGNVAHGKLPIAPRPEGVGPMTLDYVLSVSASVIVLKKWLENT